MPGVHAVVTGRDLPDSRVGRLLRDMPVLARDRVLFVGEKVAAVAAEDPEVAEEALLAIDVEYEDLPAVFDPEEAMSGSAVELHPEMLTYEGLPQPPADVPNVFAHNTWAKGDVDRGFLESDLVFEHTFTAQQHSGGPGHRQRGGGRRGCAHHQSPHHGREGPQQPGWGEDGELACPPATNRHHRGTLLWRRALT